MKPEEARGRPPGQDALVKQDRGAQKASTPATALSAAQLLTAGQLATRWQVPKSHVYRLARTGQIPLVRLGRYLRFRLDAIEVWEEEGQPHA